MIMTNTNYPMPAAVACLESMEKEYGNILNGRNFSKLNNYGLNSEFKEKLKMKYEYYNDNKEALNESTQKLMDEMFKMKEDVLNVSDVVMSVLYVTVEYVL